MDVSILKQLIPKTKVVRTILYMSILFLITLMIIIYIIKKHESNNESLNIFSYSIVSLVAIFTLSIILYLTILKKKVKSKYIIINKFVIPYPVGIPDTKQNIRPSIYEQDEYDLDYNKIYQQT